MRIRKNPEMNRIYIYFGVIAVLMIAFSIIGSNYIINKYEKVIYENDAKIVSALKGNEAAELSVIKVISGKSEADVQTGETLLSQYGINQNGINSLRAEVYSNALAISLPGILSIILILIICLVFIEKQFRRINEITAYSQRVLQKDYSLDIRENREGDISNLKNEIYKLTVMLKEQAEKQTEDKERLAIALSDISHQLKTPMTSLFVMTDLIKQDDIPLEKKNEFIETIQNQLERINWLVSSLLTLSKLDAQAIKMKKEKHSIKNLIAAALEPLSIPAELKEINIIVKDTDAYLMCDFYWSREALVNILKNCIEHTSIHGEISISFEENRLFSEIRIKDNGEGISKEDLKHIFKRFCRGENAADGSAGIGLAMAQAILLEQGGDIVCTSKKNVGTEFILKWPK